MAEYNKEKYYWIKITDRFLTSDTVDFLMGQKDGANYVVLYQLLCLKTINQNGELYRNIGEIIIPYDEEKIQRDMKWFSIDTVRVALSLYKQLGLIYQQENGFLKIADFEKMVGSQTISALKKQEQIIRRIEGGGKRVEKIPPDIDKDKDKDIYIYNKKEKSVEKKRDTPFKEFVTTYGINVDNYSGMISEMDFKALSEVYSKSKFLQKNIISLSRICKEYPRIMGGYYKDFEKPDKEEKKEKEEIIIDEDKLREKGIIL